MTMLKPNLRQLAQKDSTVQPSANKPGFLKKPGLFARRSLRHTQVLAAMVITASSLHTNLQPPTLSAQTELPPTTTPSRATLHRRITDQLVLKFATSNAHAPEALQSRIASLSTLAGTTLNYVHETSDGAHLLKLQQKLDASQLQALLQKLRDNAATLGIESVELDEIRYASLAPNDTNYSQQWDMQTASSGSYGVNAPAAWDVTTGSANYVVAVVDTGVRLSHTDLAGRTVQGHDFVQDAQMGNDGNGRDTDPNDPGDWITAAESAAGYFEGCSPTNSSWHGTHVAGTIGAAGNNGTGIAGINWQSKILPVRVLGKCGGFDSDIIAGVRWAAGINISGVATNKFPARVINLSLGGYNNGCNPNNPDSNACKCPAEWQSAINEVVTKGVVIVVAAGNENVAARAAVPNNCSGVIAVAATNKQGNRASYSNYDSSVTIAAPGGESSNGILSTVDSGVRQPAGPAYDEYSGTSMAAPHVAGIISLMVSVNPALTPAQLLQMLRSSITAFPAGSTCSTAICGAGIANAASAVLAARNSLPVTATPAPTRTPGPTPTIDPTLTIKTYLPVALR